MAGRIPFRRSFRHRPTFEEQTTAMLEAQDEVLVRVEKKLESPILNGGFDDLVQKVNKIESVSDQLNKSQEETFKKVDAIHTAVYEPDTGLYQIVKGHTGWIKATNKLLLWFGGILGTAILAGAIKLVYSFISGHIHYTP